MEADSDDTSMSPGMWKVTRSLDFRLLELLASVVQSREIDRFWNHKVGVIQ